MIVIISPAKTLEFEQTQPYEKNTTPVFLKDTEKLVESLRKKSAKELAELMEISEDLANINYERYQKWKTPFTKDNARQAIFTFNGPVYHGFDFFAYKKPEFERLQNTVRIISGLHGILRPFDLIQAYRLDMHIPLKNSAGNDLYSLWKTKVTDTLNKECKDVLVNCCSEEYSATVDFSQLKCKVVNIVFKNLKNGKYVVIGILAKKARGMFADFMVRNDPQKVDDLKKFNRSGYVFDDKSSDDNKLVFLKK